MASSIDVDKPAHGRPTTQSVRKNFAHARAEIEKLMEHDIDPDLPLVQRVALAYSAGRGPVGRSDQGTLVLHLDRPARAGTILQIWRYRFTRGQSRDGNGRSSPGAKRRRNGFLPIAVHTVSGVTAAHPARRIASKQHIPAGVTVHDTQLSIYDLFWPPNVRSQGEPNGPTTAWIQEGGTGRPTLQELGLVTGSNSIRNRSVVCMLKFGTCRKGYVAGGDGLRRSHPSTMTMGIMRWKFSAPVGDGYYWGLRAWFE